MLKTFLVISFVFLFLEAREINLDKLLKTANTSNKHLFVFLHKNHCGYCQRMIDFTLKNDTVELFLNKYFIFEHINVSENDNIIYKEFKGNGREFAKHIWYDFYPTSLFFNKNGEAIFIEAGYQNKKIPNEQRFYKILNFIQSGSYKNMELFEYRFKKEI